MCRRDNRVPCNLNEDACSRCLPIASCISFFCTSVSCSAVALSLFISVSFHPCACWFLSCLTRYGQVSFCVTFHSMFSFSLPVGFPCTARRFQSHSRNHLAHTRLLAIEAHALQRCGMFAFTLCFCPSGTARCSTKSSTGSSARATCWGNAR